MVTIKPFVRKRILIKDFIEIAKQRSNYLKNQLNCDIIALISHMEQDSQIKVANQVTNIDFILGGHDHHNKIQKIKNTLYVQGDLDFLTLNRISFLKKEDYKFFQKKQQTNYLYDLSLWMVEAEEIHLNHQINNIYSNPIIQKIIIQFEQSYNQSYGKILSYSEKKIDNTQKSIKNLKCSYLQLLVELYQEQTKTDLAFLNSGMYRQNDILEQGPITKAVLTNFIQDFLVVKQINGSQIIDFLKNMIVKYPKSSGRMSYYSGISFNIIKNMNESFKIDENSILINGSLIDFSKEYSICILDYISKGGDNFNMLIDLSQIQNQDYIKNQDLIEKLFDVNNLDPRIIKFRQKNQDKLKKITIQNTEYISLKLDQINGIQSIIIEE